MIDESIELIFRDHSKKAELEPVCEEVLKHFQIPQQKLIAIFDDKERSEFISSRYLGENFCGFFNAIRRFGRDFVDWPPDILKHVWDYKVYGKQDWRCDVVIYLRNRTCESPTGTAITFAHELQHFMQYENSRKVWWANRHLQDSRLVQGRLPPWHIPTEYEALLVSKQVTEKVLGPDNVRDYAEQAKDREQIECEGDPKKWEFFLRLDVCEEFDLQKRTTSLINECRESLQKYFPACKRDDPDYSKDDWSE